MTAMNETMQKSSLWISYVDKLFKTLAKFISLEFSLAKSKNNWPKK
jgi:hypothetical protein